jgi:hypothetical protein
MPRGVKFPTSGARPRKTLGIRRLIRGKRKSREFAVLIFGSVSALIFYNMMPKFTGFLPAPTRMRSLIKHRWGIIVDRYPMVGLLCLAGIVIALEPIWGDWWSYGLTALLALWCVLLAVASRHGRFGQSMFLIGLLIAFSTLLVHYQQYERYLAAGRFERWNQQFESLPRGSLRSGWQPAGLRGKIEQAVSYRPSYFGRRSTDQDSESSDQEGWQSTTIMMVEQIRDGTLWKPTSFLVTMSMEGKVSLLPGDRIEAFCQWKLPGRASNPGQLDQAKYFADNNLRALVKVEDAKKWS